MFLNFNEVATSLVRSFIVVVVVVVVVVVDAYYPCIMCHKNILSLFISRSHFTTR